MQATPPPTTADLLHAERRVNPVVSVLVCCTVLGLLISLICLAGYGKLGFEKAVTRLMHPVGLGWLILSGLLTYMLLCRRWRRAFAWFVPWSLLTLLSTPTLPSLGMRYLETQFVPYSPATSAPLDVLVVLGGGTSLGPYGPQAGDAGDRLVWAARLFHQGHVKSLITTGAAIEGPGMEQRSSAADHTLKIWTDLNIPPDRIRQVGGRTTYEEMQALKELLPQLSNSRVGLLTSAWHLPRALRLARAQGLDLIPVAADYRTRGEPPNWMDYIPSAKNLVAVEKLQHECMAALVSR